MCMVAMCEGCNVLGVEGVWWELSVLCVVP